ncbi:lipase [Sistotremastrum niveocremeum HHB9708]|uniref:Lipase n=2 Tax=Sistotremastraceae TaxID=3402574 RepID=A0A164X0C0_9AGAM|nr:lipase [Sistotremastrum niveocremeum HHB9708]KZT33536.1 alpha/beta-hydrolase [Sistotremastrum suecicum HHB10207 ss-3]
MVLSLSLALVLGAVSLVQASPAPSKRQTIPTLSSSQIATFQSTTFFSAAAYCSPATTINWSCGENCQKNPDFQPIAAGGDGDDVQFWYVGFDKASNSIVVAHQGTDTSEFEADLTDAKFELETLDPTLFPGISSSVEVHDGFAEEQADTATTILAAVQSGLSKFGTTKVLLTGHSLGAALSLLDSVYLPLHLPKSTTFTTIVYGLPRVGNQAFANYVDANLHLTHVNDQKDPIPIVPGMFLGFHHPSGEVHINADGSWSACPGQDNPSTSCIVGDVPNIFDGTEANHDGPYNSIFIAGDSAFPCA